MKFKSTATSIIPMDPSDIATGKGVLRVPNKWVDGKRLNRKKLFRDQSVIVINKRLGHWTLCAAWGASGIAGMNASTVVADYTTRSLLGIGKKDLTDVELEIRKATSLEEFRFYWNHHDTGYRTSSRLGLIGLVLGILGVVLSLLPIFMA